MQCVHSLPHTGLPFSILMLFIGQFLAQSPHPTQASFA